MTYTAPRTWVAAEVVTAALLNTHLRDNLKTFSDARTAYTPALTGWTLGNGTLTGFHVTANKFVVGNLKYTVGSTDTKSGEPAFSLPASSVQSTGSTIGTGGLLDTSATVRGFRFAVMSTASVFKLITEADTRLSPTAPWTWATGDIMWAEFAYEAV